MSRWLSFDEFREKAESRSLPQDAWIRATFQSEMKTADAAKRQMRFVITTGHPDRDRDCVMSAGVQLENYKRNPVILWSHSYSDLPIAKCVSITKEQNRIIAIAEFATADINPMAESVYRALQKGFLRATSIGFRPLKYAINEQRRGYDFAEVELLEFSVVCVPSNAEALALAAGVGGDPIDLAPIKAWLAACERKQGTDVIRLVDDEPLGRRTMKGKLKLAASNDPDPVLAIDVDDMRDALREIFKRELFEPLAKVAQRAIEETIAEAKGRVI